MQNGENFSLKGLFAVFAPLCVAIVGFGGKSFALTITEVEVPSEVFHWTSFEKLGRLGELQTNDFPLTFPSLHPLIFGNYRGQSDRGRQGIFTWTHPVGGVAADENEIYGNNEALIRFQLEPRAKAFRLDGSGIAEADLKGMDLLFLNRGVYKEWLLLNPTIVKSVTAHPEVLQRVVAPYLEKLRSNTPHPFDLEEIHSTKCRQFCLGPERNDLVRRLEKFMAPDAEKQIHSFFLKKPTDCQVALEKITEVE